MTARCRECKAVVEEVVAGGTYRSPGRLAYYCPRCETITFEPLRLTIERPRSSQDRHEIEDGTDAA